MADVPIPAPAAHEHLPHLAHHFDTPRQQYTAGKLGIWLFLITEILLFSGLFCAYAVYRASHPGIFLYGHRYLSVPLGAINTMVLIFSSFTMAWAVRAAQVGQRRLLRVLLAVTLACGFVFLGIKFVEYKAKWEEGLLTGLDYRPTAPPEGAVVPAAAEKETPAGKVPSAQQPARGQLVIERSVIPPAAAGRPGISPEWLARKAAHPAGAWIGPEPDNVQVFFGIYFVMTGLHGVHVVAGMGVIAWLLRRALRGDFGQDYFYPVDFTGLYWHLVDLVWIFLFPLFYLIA
jgi:cytochrome c oxidase subunit 3